MKNPAFVFAKTKSQISYTIPTQLVSAFVFASYMYIQCSTIPSLSYSNFQVFSQLLWPYGPVCVGPG